ncbi:hypothetical protein HDF19_19010 [Mucilaginibacter sp. E4BP6]|uniref:hypothetical protein n=1 Tax=Mucilaginibacter sp. E4BP6 TaxID=2723089 RepID=UPI0015C7B69B|nr:hypothetical protein [Mucilaginibacter sp. E4BP6]NYE67073.1 hypothetical protein [Mucilaginibacter sp. E4BP6]
MFKRKLICLSIICLLFVVGKLQAQTWQPGSYYDVKNNKFNGLVSMKMSGAHPVPDEAFIEYKPNDKASPVKISASELSSFVMGRDSFIVAVAPRTGPWSKYELDFVKVVVDADPKLYMFKGKVSGGGVQPDVGIGVGGGFGTGGGGFGMGLGGGISIPLGRSTVTGYYYGANTAVMKQLTPVNFIDVMSEILGDEPEIVDQLHQNKYNLRNIDKLINNYYKAQAAHGAQ